MPYRRLPNTDQARLRSLRAACNAIERESPATLCFSQKLALEVKAFTPIFEQAVNQYTDSRTLQSNISKQVSEAARNARLYVSHFIQVFNMCIARGEIKPEARNILGLGECGSNLPELIPDPQLMEWGNKVVQGEEQRIAMGGGNRIYNPSIAVVKVKMSQFTEHYNKHRDLLQTIQKHHAKLEELRVRADELILNVWNEVEAACAPIEEEENRNRCIEYGVIYFYRPHERQKEFLLGTM